MRRSEIARKTRMKKNAARAKKRYEEAFGLKADYIRRIPCCACGKDSPSDPHHVKSRGAGGTSADLVPLCGPTAAREGCHRELHRTGRETFERAWNVDLATKAAQYERWWQDGEEIF